MIDTNEASVECKSVLRGFYTRVEDNLLEVVRDLVNSWNDPYIRPEFVCEVQRGLKYHKGNGKHNLFITSIDRQSTNMLIVGAKQYMNPLDGIIWGPFIQSRVCETFIEGLITKSDHNLTEVVKQLVFDWKDPEVGPSFVENTTIDHKNGKELIVVTATSAQNSRALVKAAKKHLNVESGLKWYFSRRFEP